MVRSDVVVLIPAFREASTIAQVVEEARQYADVIVVDDCSPDRTAELAANAGAVVLKNVTNLGYEGSLNRGLETLRDSGYRTVVTMDADGEHDPACLARFVKEIDAGAKLIVGIRKEPARFAEHLFCRYVRWRYGVSDVLCGMKAYDLDALKGIAFDARDSIGTALVIKMARRGISASEFAVNGKDRTDEPRFGNRLTANVKLMKSLIRLITEDISLWIQRSLQFER